MNLKQCLSSKTRNWEGDRYDTPNGPFWYADNGGSILGIAHTDVVGFTLPRRRGPIIQCMQLDDRLGVWVLTHLLPSLGVTLDTLLTDGEESARSTAAWFDSPKQYNWVVEFDRAGDDVVFYQYEENNWARAWEEEGFPIGIGSFSDISMMSLNVCAANMGIGYHCQHTPRCYANLKNTIFYVREFARFWNTYKDIPFPYEEPSESYPSENWWKDDIYIK